MRSYFVRHALMNLKTSPRMTLRFRMPSCLQQLMIQFCCTCAISTAVTSRAPLLTHSIPIPPVPAKRSKTSIPSSSIRLLSRLNRLSFAKSVVGLAVIFLGGDIRRPPYIPEIILITPSYRRCCSARRYHLLSSQHSAPVSPRGR